MPESRIRATGAMEMLSADLNAQLTKVGPGTPCGDLLRRYWHPICPASLLTIECPITSVQVLGESLVVFRQPDGKYGALPEQCPHRGASLRFGFVEDQGIRCAYHGWLFDRTGVCREMPFEASKNPSDIRIAGYPIEEHAGLLFVYMGPQSSQPPVPMWDILARNDGRYRIELQSDLKSSRTDSSGVYTMDTFFSQDSMAWETQGEVYDRTHEHLGASDAGVSIFRQMLKEQVDRVAAGGEPTIGRSQDHSIIDLREWMDGYLPMSAPADPSPTKRRRKEEIFDERHRIFLVPDGRARVRLQRPS